MKVGTRARRLLFLSAAAMAALSIVLSGCASTSAGPQDDRLHVTVSIVPQQYFVKRIGGDHVSTSVMVLPGNNPETYEPKPEQLKALSRSAAYFSLGVPFEDLWLDRIAESNRDMVIVDTIAGIDRMPMVAHDHGDDEEETDVEGAPDPHVWVSPELVKVQAQAICDALVELDPDHEDEYRVNLDAFVADIDELEADIHKTLSRADSRKFMVFHPAWGYFARDFDLEQIAVEVGGQEPSAQELASVIAEARHDNIRVIFAQPEFSTQKAETIAQEINGEVLLVSPLAEDWLANMREVAAALASALNRD